MVKKLLGSSLQFIDAFTKEAHLLHDLNPDNIVQFKAVCHEPVAVMLKYLYFHLSVSEEKERSLYYFIIFILT